MSKQKSTKLVSGKVKQQLQKLAEKYEAKLDEESHKQEIAKNIKQRLTQEQIVKAAPVEDVHDTHFSYVTAKHEVHRPELAKHVVPAEQAGSFAKPTRYDLEQEKLSDNEFKQSIAQLDFASIREAIKKRLEAAKPKVKLPAELANRVSSGIVGFDKLIAGGFEQGSVNLISGGAGSGKSIFCMQFLMQGVKQGEAGVYITFEESKEKFCKHMFRFGWDLKKLEAEGKFVLLQYTPAQIKKVLEEGGGAIEAVINKINAKRLVIDSLTAFTLLYENELAAREAVLRLFEFLARLDCTVLVTAEQELDPDKHTSNMLEFEVDSVILLYYLRKGNARVRAIEIYKMRGTDHAKGLFPMRITSRGIVVYPEQEVF